MTRRFWIPKRVTFVDYLRNHATELVIEDFHTELDLPDKFFNVRALGKPNWLLPSNVH